MATKKEYLSKLNKIRKGKFVKVKDFRKRYNPKTLTLHPDCQNIDNLTKKSKLTKKDIDKIAHRINKESSKEMR